MNGTPYSRSCCKTVKKFFDDFDMLPIEYKQLLWDGASTPGFDDVKLAWELASADKSLADLIKQVSCMKPTKEEKKAQADRERERLKNERRQNRKHSYYETRAILGKPQLRTLDPKQARLVLRVTEEELEKMLVRRREGKDVRVYSEYVRPILGYERVKVEIDPNTIPPEKKEPPQQLIKMMHNAGGKKSS
jgi:hypothetical protein